MSGHDLNVHLLLNLVRANLTCFRCSGCLNAQVRIRAMKIAYVLSTKSHEFAHLFYFSIFTKILMIIAPKSLTQVDCG